MNDRATFSKASAAAYLDMSVSKFDDTVRPFVAYISIDTPGQKRPMLRWMKADLDAYVAARRRAA